MDRIQIEEAIERIGELPTLPSVLGKILNTAADPDASALDLGEHITTDQSLSATLLKLVNSAFYGFHRQITSVTQAIVILGFLEVRNLALTATAFRTLDTGATDYDRVQLWRHSLASAMAADAIKKKLGEPIEGAFEAGLLHDIGKVVLDMLYPEIFVQAARQAHAESRTIADVLKERVGIDHAEVGGLLAEHWELPPAVVAAIRYHLRPEEAPEASKLIYVAAAANALTYPAGLGESSNGTPLEVPESAREALGLNGATETAVIEKLLESKENIDEFLGALAR